MAGINSDETNKKQTEKQLLHQGMCCCTLCCVSGTCGKACKLLKSKSKIWVITLSNSKF